MKTFHRFFLGIFLLFLIFSPFKKTICFADSENGSVDIYLIYDELNNVLFEANIVEVGDIFITKEFKQYEVYLVDNEKLLAYAEYVGRYIRPRVIHNERGDKLNLAPKEKKTVGLYLTHNDESYLPTDGVSSVYGRGGVHDVATALARSFNNLNYDVYLDESLHIPHDSAAYSRSALTAKRLLEKDVDALFDVHRDGVSRSVYVKRIDGVERCKVRIVVGQGNASSEANLQFAMYLLTIAEEFCPWLFLDIYMAKGHYNQGLYSKALLFEMGTYLAEKELVLATVPFLASVVDKTLFSTVVQEDNSLIITDEVQEGEEQNLVTNVLENFDAEQNFHDKYVENIVIFVVLLLGLLGVIVFFAIKRSQKKKTEKYSVSKRKD